MTSKNLILVTGRPHSGQSTLARGLAEYLEYDHVDLDTEIERQYFGSVGQLHKNAANKYLVLSRIYREITKSDPVDLLRRSTDGFTESSSAGRIVEGVRNFNHAQQLTLEFNAFTVCISAPIKTRFKRMVASDDGPLPALSDYVFSDELTYDDPYEHGIHTLKITDLEPPLDGVTINGDQETHLVLMQALGALSFYNRLQM